MAKIYAVVTAGAVTKSGSINQLFPNVSFPDTGPSAAWLTANSVQEVLSTKPYDQVSQVLSPVAPYVDATDSLVYNVQPTDLALAAVQTNLKNSFESSYGAAKETDISFTTAGSVTQTFQGDATARSNLRDAYIGYIPAGTVPAGFYWRAKDNTKVPFTFADLQNFYNALLSRGWALFQHKSDLKDATSAATAISFVSALPATLAANTLYVVSQTTGGPLFYVSDATGATTTQLIW